MKHIAGVISTLLLTLPLVTMAAPVKDTAMISIQGEAQGTTYQIRYFDPQNRNFKHSIDSVLTEFDKCLSLYRSDSELSAFNRTSRHTFRSAWFYDVLVKSKEIHAATGGAFDPTIMPLSEAYGFGNKKNVDPENVNVDSLLQFIGFKQIEFNNKEIKARPGVKLDLNGIAQGYSVDIVGAFLKSRGIHRFMVEIGGEVICSGTKNGGNAWITGIENPLKPQALAATVALTNRAMTTAGNYRNHFTRNGITYNHIIDPRTGDPLTGSTEQTPLLSVTVFAKDAITADGYDTAFFVMGLEATKTFLKNRKDIDVYMLYSSEDGHLMSYATDGIKEFIQEK
ncbi:thiamine biosynthesis lipoprotein [Dyadobacter sp. BE34]|uniref:FAD:protein FMN transferase n=1 Tax=Dyadobacter fermentans TaxID=94254 RepID=A0ABU1R1D6_9BACT|nr:MULTISPECIES: FAD:protein FMN transferase [Dyadobacter]MDR6807223.1 thiamine biosynthesis lipoprotein [Dyadobacter fermentans]MDR7044964.1 thiamine biosynthesis lipoprotein [Dyadobacter sp. BE242]MDR7199300.1 thiamine biosynthesis lipoprotein [Dyadobacter sp. BE34]MDR7217260.1 thiamine biosynthesis lipoprotein [Dyadobacter sp. BE31]MDR7265193.1 thiamine biosynthesis lipoprotein [Dyadobacter sp. BE32]